MPNYYESNDGEELVADQIERWDADENFWRLDTWTEAQLADNKRFNHYAANVERRKLQRRV